MLYFSYILVKLPPVFLWNVAQTPTKVKTPCAALTLRSIYAYDEGNGCCEAYNIQKSTKNSNFLLKNPVFGPKLAPVPSKYKYIYIFYEIYHSPVNVYRFMVFKEKYTHVEWHMLPVLLAKYGGPQKFDPILAVIFS